QIVAAAYRVLVVVREVALELPEQIASIAVSETKRPERLGAPAISGVFPCTRKIGSVPLRKTAFGVASGERLDSFAEDRSGHVVQRIRGRRLRFGGHRWGGSLAAGTATRADPVPRRCGTYSFQPWGRS